MPELVMPKMGDAMEEGTIVRWLKKVGDKVSEQEEVAEIATEKANITVPATEAGTLTQILVREGETVPVGTPIAFLDAGNGAQPPAKPAPDRAAGGAAAVDQKPGAEALARAAPQADLSRRAPEPAPDAQPGPAPAAEGGRVKASPLARKIAAEHGVDLSGLQGSGPSGRIVEADVTDAISRGPAPTAPPSVPGVSPPHQAPVAGTDRPMSQMRKVIARRMSFSKQTVPHFYLTLDVDMRAAARLRSEYNGSVAEDRKISFNDLVVRACALALERRPALNARLEGEMIRQPDDINVGVAVSLEEGLIVPVVRDTPGKSLSVIGREVRELADRARKGQLKPDEYAGGTFTVSNLGMYDITDFQAIINTPEAAILAVGSIRDTPIVENGQVVPGKQMNLTISVDHRIVDGQTAAKFMQEVKRLLEAPITLFG